MATEAKDEKLFLVCACSSFEHQAIFWKCEDPHFEDLEVYIHLQSWRSFWKRLKYGLKYAFGHKSNYGAWDAFIFSKDDEGKLYEFLKSRCEKPVNSLDPDAPKPRPYDLSAVKDIMDSCKKRPE